jgi:hypothetical protein
MQQLGTKLEWLVLTPLKPSLETNHPNCETARLGPPQGASPWFPADDTASPFRKENL